MPITMLPLFGIVMYLILRTKVIICNTCVNDVSKNSIHLTAYELISSSLALFTILISFLEYQNHKKKRGLELLSEYNKKYCENETFKSIIIDLIKFDEKIKTKESFKLGTSDDDLTILYERELFMRFFEELQFQIENGNLDKKQTKELFSWYAKTVSEIGDNFVSDYNQKENNPWLTFKRFVKE